MTLSSRANHRFRAPESDRRAAVEVPCQREAGVWNVASFGRITMCEEMAVRLPASGNGLGTGWSRGW